MKAFLRRWLDFQHKRRVLFLALLMAVVAYGVKVAVDSEIEAFPDLTNVQVQVITQFPGKAAEEVERQITVPLEVATVGTPGLINRRSVSLFGLSVITLTFDDNVSLKQARLDVAQHLGDADLPEGVKPGVSPESTPTGEIFRYTLQGDLPVDELRLIEDWTLEREFKSLPGVADVVSFGGPIRTIEVRLDVPRMTALGLKAADVAQALGQNSANAGGSVLTHGEEAYLVRSLGLYEKPEDLESAVLASAGDRNVPVRVRDIGRVVVSHRMRLGQVGRNGEDDVVEGIVLLRKDANVLDTCRQIREKIVKINATHLPPGTKVVPYYDRTDLIQRSSHTVFHNIGFGIFLVCLILTLGLGTAYWPMIAAVALIIPFALLTAMVGIRFLGYHPNLISLGAVDFGIIVETAIFAAESLIFALSRRTRRDEDTISEALEEVLAPALLCAFLLVVAFIPILSLQRVEGRIFRPLGITLVSALVGGQLGALVFIPLFSDLTPTGIQKQSRLDVFFKWVLSSCETLARKIAKVPRAGVVFVVLFSGFTIGLGWGVGREFLPELNEGALWIRATAPPTISREASVALAKEVRRRLQEIPEVVNVVSQTGRPDDGTDINGFNNIEFAVNLSAPESWKTGHTINDFIALAQGKMKGMEGVDFSYSQPIKDNVDEAISGVKAELVVKIFGPNVQDLQAYADKVAEILQRIPGAQDVAAEELLGQPELRFDMNHDMLARYGLRVTDAEDVLETALLGKFATRMIDQKGRGVDVLIRPDLPEAPNRQVLGSLPILTPGGAKIPLEDVSSPKLVEGVNRIYREQGERRIGVKMSVRGRAVVDFVVQAGKEINKAITLPSGYRLEWSGSFENAKRASQRLLVIVPLCVLAMGIILYTWFGRWGVVGYLLWEVPFSAAGALTALRLTGLNLSISAAAGGIVLIGVSLLSAMMLLSGWLHGGSAKTALETEGRGILLSNGVAIVGLIPAAFSHGIGAETARPFAVTILGGLITSLIFTLTVLPGILARTTPPNFDQLMD